MNFALSVFTFDNDFLCNIWEIIRGGRKREGEEREERERREGGEWIEERGEREERRREDRKSVV